MTLEINTQAAQKLEAYRVKVGLTHSDAILKLIQVAEIEAAFDRLEETPEIPNELASELALEAVRSYRSRT